MLQDHHEGAQIMQTRDGGPDVRAHDIAWLYKHDPFRQEPASTGKWRMEDEYQASLTRAAAPRTPLARWSTPQRRGAPATRLLGQSLPHVLLDLQVQDVVVDTLHNRGRVGHRLGIGRQKNRRTPSVVTPCISSHPPLTPYHQPLSPTRQQIRCAWHAP